MKNTKLLFVLYLGLALGFSDCSRGKPKAGELFRAAARGDLKLVTELVKRGADVNEDFGTPDHQLTPLLAAVSKKHEVVAVYLIGAGARIHSTFRGYAPEDFALYLDQASVVRRISQTPRSEK